MKKQYRSFDDARKFTRQLCLKNRIEWRDYCRLGKKPDNIPNSPHHVYKNKWIGWRDWLGTEKNQWLTFVEARKIIQSLKLQNREEFKKFVKLDKIPNDIPKDPQKMYRDKGWKSWGDWLGTGFVATQLRSYRSYKSAQKFVSSLKLQNKSDWSKYCQSGKKPKDIPSSPEHIYKKEWKGMMKWLGRDSFSKPRIKYLEFFKARQFAQRLKLQNHREWIDYCSSGKKPEDIPNAPHHVYKNEGWVSYGDWLGTGIVATYNIKYMDFEKAKEFVQKLNLKSSKEWLNYCRSGKKPDNIPAGPGNVYKNKGWISMGDWLGTGIVATYNIKYMDFEKAKEFVHSLDLNSEKDWREYYASHNLPTNVPRNPSRVYKDKGWKGIGDWLGTKRIANQNKVFMTFTDAKKFVHFQKLKSMREWKEYCKSGNKPDDIPANPNSTYKDKGWKDWGDFLGTRQVAPKNRKYRSFESSKKFVHSLKLKNMEEWKKFCQSENKPQDIPNAPNHIYKNSGWKDWGDFLGTGFILSGKRKYRSFQDAKKFIRSLGLKTWEEWIEYCKSGNKPDDIPANPNVVYTNKTKKKK